MKHAQLVHGQFLDLEAAVDEGEGSGGEEEEEMDLEEMFIHDDIEDEDQPSTHRLFTDNREDDETELGADYDALLDRVLGESRNAPIQHYATWEPSEEDALRVEKTLRHPTIQDSPLYRVACKIGREENIVMRLLYAATPAHELHSAFTPDIYEAIYQAIDLKDRSKVLALPKNSRSIQHLQWVRILTGLYKGDVGIVAETRSWGASLLVVPRLAYNMMDDPKGKGKRKASYVRPDPRLFDPKEFQRNSSKQIQTKGTLHRIGRLEFMDGLLYKRYAYSSLSGPVIQMPWSLSSMFAFALDNPNHKDVDLERRPRPQEWIFFIEEKVVVQSSGKHGIIRGLEAEYAEVECKDEGTQPVYWYNMQKDISVGNFVTILNGHSQGYEGWVIELTKDVAKVLDRVPTTGDASIDEAILIQVNRLRVIDTPIHLSQQGPCDGVQFQKIFRHPWCDTKVLIAKIGHARKGEPAIVTAVLDDPTGIRLHLQLSRYDPNKPFSKLTVDCDDVVEATTRKSLTLFFNIQDTSARKDTNLRHTSFAGTILTGGATPMPTETSTSSTPAWDPSSQTPRGFDNTSEETQFSQSSSALVHPPAPQHDLLNPLLVGASVKAIVHGGNYTNQLIDVSIRNQDGRTGLFHHRHTTLIPLEPQWVTPKIPSPTHDHGLLIVIKGEHCGTYVRRIAHIMRSGAPKMILAVVQHAPKSTDILTGKRLELAPDLLCKSTESDSDKKRNKNVMTTIRKEFRS
ncbi:hypothetical protein BJ912DRAFT_1063575 [Pholiota molesta]|nr:hypothetical protein BJ912DRAFT_1063575 [Pholiota molesta]